MSEKITAVHIQRYKNRAWGLSDPCFICGGKFIECGHDVDDTEAFIRRIRQLGSAQREAILNGK